MHLINTKTEQVVEHLSAEAQAHFLATMADAADWVPHEPDLVVDGVPRDAAGLRLDGPTVAEYVAAGYLAANYPPADYASKSSFGEVEDAIAAQAAALKAKAEQMAMDAMAEVEASEKAVAAAQTSEATATAQTRLDAAKAKLTAAEAHLATFTAA